MAMALVREETREQRQGSDRTPAARSDLLSLIDDFSHDVRTPLSVIDEFAAMLREGILAGGAERDAAAGLICDKAAEILRLVETLETLVRAQSGCIVSRRDECPAQRVLNDALVRIRQIDASGLEDGKIVVEETAARVRCDVELAAVVLSQLWEWVQRSRPRDVCAAIGVRSTSSPATVSFSVSKRNLRLPLEWFRPTSPSGRDPDGPPCKEALPRDLHLRLAFELGRLAGGDVIGNPSGLALLVPAVEANGE